MKNKHLEMLIDSFPGAMVLSDLTGNVLAINKNLAFILETPREELIGKSGYNFIESDVAKTRKVYVEEAIKTKKTVESGETLQSID